LAHHAEGRARRLELFTLGQKSPTSTMLNLRQVHVLVDPEQAAQADAWVNTLMQRAYPVTKPFRRVLLLVNPVGGKGKARSIVKEQIMPILEAAGCKVEVVETLHSKHAEEICAAADLSQYE
jgi:sphingosine kinase